MIIDINDDEKQIIVLALTREIDAINVAMIKTGFTPDFPLRKDMEKLLLLRNRFTEIAK